MKTVTVVFTTGEAAFLIGYIGNLTVAECKTDQEAVMLHKSLLTLKNSMTAAVMRISITEDQQS